MGLEKLGIPLDKEGKPKQDVNLSEHFDSEAKDGTEETEAKKIAAIEKIEQERIREIDADIERYGRFVDQLDKARQNHTEYEEVQSYIEAFPDIKEKFDIARRGLKKYHSTLTSSHDLIEFLADSAYKIIKSREAEKSKLLKKEEPQEEDSEVVGEKAEETTDSGKTEEVPEEKAKEDIIREKMSEKPLEELREIYLKAKKFRGNVIRGRMGKLLNREIDFDGIILNFAGKKGEEDLSFIRDAYEEKLQDDREVMLKEEEELRGKLERGEINQNEYFLGIKKKILLLVSAEQRNIDDISVREAEKGLFEKIKNKWRELDKARVAGGSILGLAPHIAGSFKEETSVKTAGFLGAFVGTEAAIERWSKKIGHKGLVDIIEKDTSKFLTEEALVRNIFGLSSEDVKNEAARLRMLQLEKGVGILDSRELYGDDRDKIVELIIKRDSEILAEEIMEEIKKENPGAVITKKIGERLSKEVDERNQSVENEVDRERLKKIMRKSISTAIGVGSTWFIGA